MDNKITNEVHSEQECWSELPTGLVWMVQDRLNRVDNARIGFISSNWSSSSQSYKRKAQDNCVDVPWLMNYPCSGNECEYINISTKEKFVLDLPEFHSSKEFSQFMLFSKSGWLLFRRFTEDIDVILVLFDIFTNSSIILSQPKDDSSLGLLATFSLSNNKGGLPKPELIVLLRRKGSNTIRLQIGKVCDNTWTIHSYKYKREVYPNGSLLINDNKVYHLDQLGELLIFDINSHVWTKIFKNIQLGKATSNIRWWMMEAEGEIVKIGCGRDDRTFCFYKLNGYRTIWEVLKDDKDWSWFLHAKTRNNHFPVKEIGAKNKIYRIEPYQEAMRHPLRDFIRVYNESDSLVLPYKPEHGTFWVDLGMMDKVPSSCKVYESI